MEAAWCEGCSASRQVCVNLSHLSDGNDLCKLDGCCFFMVLDAVGTSPKRIQKVLLESSSLYMCLWCLSSFYIYIYISFSCILMSSQVM